MPNGETASGILPNEALTFEVRRFKEEKRNAELAEAIRLLSEAQTEDAIVALQGIKAAAAEGAK